MGETAAETTYTYSANGHTKTQMKNGVVTEYSYNHEERLIAVKRDNQVVAEYAYNPHGQRIKKTVNGTTTWYFYNGNGLAAEYSNTGQLIKEYHFHPQKTWMTDPLFQRTAGGELYYYHNDHLGTPQQMLDSVGNIVWEAQYSAFGTAYITINTVENNLRFPGQYFDEETGLHQNYFRDYDSELGRYLQEDPFGIRGGINYYIYVNGNPVIFKDIFGLVPEGCWLVKTGGESSSTRKVEEGIEYVRWSAKVPNPAWIIKEYLKLRKPPRDGRGPDAGGIDLIEVIQWAKDITTTIRIEEWAYGYMRCESEDECGNKKYNDHWHPKWLESSNETVEVKTVNTRRDYIRD